MTGTAQVVLDRRDGIDLGLALISAAGIAVASMVTWTTMSPTLTMVAIVTCAVVLLVSAVLARSGRLVLVAALAVVVWAVVENLQVRYAEGSDDYLDAILPLIVFPFLTLFVAAGAIISLAVRHLRRHRRDARRPIR